MSHSLNNRIFLSIPMLMETDMHISEIAYKLGFNDPKYFSRCFKNKTGFKPSHFRNNSLNREKVQFNLNREFLSNTRKIIIENLDDMNFNSETLAGLMNMSSSTFYRKFRNLNDTPHNFIRATRLKYARELIETGVKDLNKVLKETGYFDTNYFSRCFKKEYGMTPRELILAC